MRSAKVAGYARMVLRCRRPARKMHGDPGAWPVGAAGSNQLRRAAAFQIGPLCDFRQAGEGEVFRSVESAGDGGTLSSNTRGQTGLGLLGSAVSDKSQCQMLGGAVQAERQRRH
jgi:hypothetical protein